jgi:carotenoid cleavage dioxygenase-like enzyme
VLIVLISHLFASPLKIKRISVANTAIYFHDRRALATCESGPPMRIQLPELETVGWYDGNKAEGEPPPTGYDIVKTGFGGKGLFSFMKEWTTAHPRIDPRTGDLIIFHCSFVPPFVYCSVIPPLGSRNLRLLNIPVPGVSGGKMMHDFGVSLAHTVILDLPLTLSPLNLLAGSPIVAYEPERPSRFGVFPRHVPRDVRWFETHGCCIFHTANTWDEYDTDGTAIAVNMLVCRLTSASLVYGPGNILPPTQNRKHARGLLQRWPFLKNNGERAPEDVEGRNLGEKTPFLPMGGPPLLSNPDGDQQEECRLYYYQFSLTHPTPRITHQYALSVISFEFPTLNPAYEMSSTRYIYGCSTTADSFSAALGKATKIDVLMKMDVGALLARGKDSTPPNITGSVDTRSLAKVLVSQENDASIQPFLLPPGHYAQEARFVSRAEAASEDDGFLLFYVFDESQLDEEGECPPDSVSELWILDARTMKDVVAKVILPQRVPYGFHGNWFSEAEIESQRAVQQFRTVPMKRARGARQIIMDTLLGAFRQ